MFQSFCEVKTLAVQWLGTMLCLTLACSYIDGSFLEVSTKSHLSSSGLYNVHETSLVEGECELNY